MAVHRYVLPAMAHAAATNVPASYLAVYSAPELAVLALAGLVIAVCGALLPAGWAARSAAATGSAGRVRLLPALVADGS